VSDRLIVPDHASLIDIGCVEEAITAAEIRSPWGAQGWVSHRARTNRPARGWRRSNH
jgi:hypothetical protein